MSEKCHHAIVKRYALLKREHLIKIKLMNGGQDSRQFLTGDSGMVIIWGRQWVSGTLIMVPVQQKERFTSEGVPIISQNLMVPKSISKTVISIKEIPFL